MFPSKKTIAMQRILSFITATSLFLFRYDSFLYAVNPPPPPLLFIFRKLKIDYQPVLINKCLPHKFKPSSNIERAVYFYALLSQPFFYTHVSPPRKINHHVQSNKTKIGLGSNGVPKINPPGVRLDPSGIPVFLQSFRHVQQPFLVRYHLACYKRFGVVL